MRRARLRLVGPALALAALGAVIWDGRAAEALLPVGDVPPVVFERFERRGTPNEFLACPPYYFRCHALPDRESPVLGVPVERLAAAWGRVVAGEPRVSLLRADAASLQYDYVQRSAVFRFPDLVTVRFFPLEGARSSLAIYSRSVYGRGDLGVNRRRVERWLAVLRTEVARG